MEQIAFGEMPPKKKKRPDATESAKIVAWLESELAKAGHPSGLREKLQAPEYGNYVDHQKLFDDSIQAASYSPARLWKRSPNIFDSLLVRGIGLGKGRYGHPNGHVG